LGYSPCQSIFLCASKRFKDGKTHRYWSVVENRRVSGGRTVQKTLLYLGEINDSDRASWTRAIEAVDERDATRQIHLFPEDRTPDPLLKHPSLKLRFDQMRRADPSVRYLTGEDPAELWRNYINLVRIEESFRTLKGDLGLRPVFYQLDGRIEAHAFISFLAAPSAPARNQKSKACGVDLLGKRTQSQRFRPENPSNSESRVSPGGG
jgi:hypothetical protein